MISEQSQKAAYEGTLELAARAGFSALFAVLDPMAVAAMAALRSIGKELPRDCAVIGFDDNEMLSNYTTPSLTTVANPFYATGRLAAERICAFARGESLEPVAPLPTRLIIRSSCGCTSSGKGTALG
jgi:DNA-binding LacI/PurR family transcriptional regulator